VFLGICLYPKSWSLDSTTLVSKLVIFVHGKAHTYLLLASSQQGLQHFLDWFSAVCGQARMKISTKNTVLYISRNLLCLSRNPRQCTLQEYSATGREV